MIRLPRGLSAGSRAGRQYTMPRDILFRYLEIGTDRLLHNAACRDPGSGILAGVTIGKRALVAGTVVTRDIEDGAMGVGRARMEVKPGFAVKLFEKLRARKAAKKGH